jgi:uncharacterized membrane protein YhaH (DUF805 family)
MNWGNLLFSFRGRINRAKYWLAILVYLIFWLIMVAIAFATAFIAPWLMFILFGIAIIPSIISGIAIGIKRLHDRDKSGWWLLLFYLVPSVLERIGDRAINNEPVAIIVYLASFAISIWGFVEIGCLRGTIGANRYGPDPIAPKPAQH